MGLDVAIVEFLRAARERGVSFERTLTLGRQDLLVWGDDLARLGLPEPTAEALLGSLGASKVDSLDAAPFEGATIIHDLNAAPHQRFGPYTAVLDAGTLEHVFNFPVAVATALEAVGVNGHFLAISPANNEAGHGFYQFSPELWFRVLSKANGFRLERALLKEMHRRGGWYELVDPDDLGQRGSFVSRGPTYLFFQARRVEAVPPFEEFPQQSDYLAMWVGAQPPRPAPRPRLPLLARVRGSLAYHARRRLRSKPQPFYRASYRDQPAHFRPIERP